jgi:PHD/YefM family antitoxin component YafN of YafNO toxin-antitoxin module
MEFLSVKELTARPKRTWEILAKEGEIAITNNGRPKAIMVEVDETGFEETLRSIRQAKAMRLLESIWDETRGKGALTDEEIAEEIARARKEKHA